jgi:glutamate/tyrosine decarboxylase-like PLP-dependent enzyme
MAVPAPSPSPRVGRLDEPAGGRPRTGAGIWGDEGPVVEAVLAWAGRRVVRSTDPHTTARPARELAEATGPTIVPGGIGAERALALFDEVLVPATRAQDDPLNLSYIPSAPTRAAVAFEVATSAANIFAGLWESGAGAIHAENQVLAWIAGLLGWPATAGGCFVSGGTSGNLSALVAARHTAQARRLEAGLAAVPTGGWAVACSPDAHSSVRSAARVMGVEVLEVPGDDRGRLTGAALGPALDAAGDRVVAVVASAGTTNAGIVDDLAGVADVCSARGVWLHVDGAYGGAALVAPSVRPLFTGIERADSFIVDPHKWLFAPYDCCALVYRRPELARAAHAQTAGYLDEVDREEWNPADLAVHLTRRPRGLPLWFSLAVHGTDAYRDAVERSLATARTVAGAVRERPFLRLVEPPELSVLLFERTGWGEREYRNWSRAHALAGDFLVLPTRWQGRCLLRMAFVNPATDPAAVVAALDTLV